MMRVIADQQVTSCWALIPPSGPNIKGRPLNAALIYAAGSLSITEAGNMPCGRLRILALVRANIERESSSCHAISHCKN